MGFRVKKGQQLNHKDLDMMESVSKVRETSTNPLCKVKTKKPRSLSYCGKHQFLIVLFFVCLLKAQELSFVYTENFRTSKTPTYSR